MSVFSRCPKLDEMNKNKNCEAHTFLLNSVCYACKMSQTTLKWATQQYNFLQCRPPTNNCLSSWSESWVSHNFVEHWHQTICPFWSFNYQKTEITKAIADSHVRVSLREQIRYHWVHSQFIDPSFSLKSSVSQFNEIQNNSPRTSETIRNVLSFHSWYFYPYHTVFHFIATLRSMRRTDCMEQRRLDVTSEYENMSKNTWTKDVPSKFPTPCDTLP